MKKGFWLVTLFAALALMVTGLDDTAQANDVEGAKTVWGEVLPADTDPDGDGWANTDFDPTWMSQASQDEINQLAYDKDFGNLSQVAFNEAVAMIWQREEMQMSGHDDGYYDDHYYGYTDYEMGYDDGWYDGYYAGYDDGWYDAGYGHYYDDYSIGYDDGWYDGYYAGYDAGWYDGYYGYGYYGGHYYDEQDYGYYYDDYYYGYEDGWYDGYYYGYNDGWYDGHHGYDYFDYPYDHDLNYYDYPYYYDYPDDHYYDDDYYYDHHGDKVWHDEIHPINADISYDNLAYLAMHEPETLNSGPLNAHPYEHYFIHDGYEYHFMFDGICWIWSYAPVGH